MRSGSTPRSVMRTTRGSLRRCSRSPSTPRRRGSAASASTPRSTSSPGTCSDSITSPAEQVLLATTDAARMARLLSQPEPARDGLLRALADRMGAVGGLIVGAVASGHAGDALPLALAARAAVADAEGSYAQARIEALTGVSSPSGAALSAYAEVGERCAVVLRQSNRDVLDDVIARGDALVRDIHAAGPEASPVLWTGFDARLRALAEVVTQMASPPAEVDPSVLRAAVERVRTHMGAAAPAGTPRAERAELAARLAPWLAGLRAPRRPRSPSPRRPTSVTAPTSTGRAGASPRVTPTTSSPRRSGPSAGRPRPAARTRTRCSPPCSRVGPSTGTRLRWDRCGSSPSRPPSTPSSRRWHAGCRSCSSSSTARGSPRSSSWHRSSGAEAWSSSRPTVRAAPGSRSCRR